MVNHSTPNVFDIFQAVVHFIVNLLVHLICLPFYLIYAIYMIIKYFICRVELKNRLTCKRNQLKGQFDALRDHLNHLDTGAPDQLLRLTKLNLNAIQDQLLNGEISSLDLLHAYQWQSLNLHSSGNSGICQFVDEAEQQAVNLASSTYEADYKSTLYGIPISIKELCPMQGYDITFGLIKRCIHPTKEPDCNLIRVLKARGAIPFVLTATSHLAISLSGINPVFGDMSNPVCDKNEPGGSSSGEGVLIKLGGSPVGVGSDLGGSIRIPSAFCGIAGLKPTSHRLSIMDTVTRQFKAIEMNVVHGPMAMEVENLVKFMRTVLCPMMFDLDPSIPRLPFNESMYSGLDNPKLKIGYYDRLEGDLVMSTVPSVRRAIQEALNYLKQFGHIIEPFNPPRPDWAHELALKSFCTDYFYTVSDDLFAEPMNQHTGLLQILVKIPWTVKWLMDKLIGWLIGKPAAILRFSSGPPSKKATIELATDIVKYRYDFGNAWINNGDFDVVICPAFAFPATPKVANTILQTPAVIYTVLYNLVDYPAGVVCVGQVNQYDLNCAKEEAQAAGNAGNKYWKSVLEMQKDLELPLGIQVVAKPFHEEVALRIMRDLERIIQNRTW